MCKTKEKFIARTNDEIKQQEQALRVLKGMNVVTPSFDNKVYNVRYIKAVNEFFPNVRDRIYKDENGRSINITLDPIGSIGYNSLNVKLCLTDNGRIDSEGTLQEIEKTIDYCKKKINDLHNDVLLYDEEIEERKKVWQVIDEYHKKYSYRLRSTFSENKNYRYW